MALVTVCCHLIQDGLGFWIPGNGFQSLSLELGFWFSIASAIPDSLSCSPDSKAQDSGFHMQIFSRFPIPQLKFPRFAYMGRYILKPMKLFLCYFLFVVEHVTDPNRTILWRERIKRKKRRNKGEENYAFIY